MFKKVLLVLSLLFLLLISTGSSQEDMTHVDNSYFKNPQRTQAVFNHDQHSDDFAIECATCHHLYDEEGNLIEGESSEGTPCADCHALKKEGNKPSLMKAYHSNCIDCHTQSKGGPISCGECHKK